MTFDPRAWREVSGDELPQMLDCSALSGAACKQVRREFMAAGVKGLKSIARELKRPPTQSEADMLHAALVRWFNEHRIPEITPEVVH